MSAIQFDQAMIERRKRADNAYRAMDEVIANDKKIVNIGQFLNGYLVAGFRYFETGELKIGEFENGFIK
jgi:hypothetical protein